MSVISIFGSGKVEPASSEYKLSELVGSRLAENGFDLATGGYFGIMEAALKGASNFNNRRIAVTTKYFQDRKPNIYGNETIETNSYTDRLIKLTEIADAFVIFPGGSGTLFEFAYILAMKERNVFKEKPLICIGDEWENILKIIGFDNEKDLIESYKIICVDNDNDVVKIIVDFIKR